MMKKILFVNNNMHIGGVQKSLVNLLREIKDDYKITLVLFSATGDYLRDIPDTVKVVSLHSLFRCLGVSQQESRSNPFLFIKRTLLAAITKAFGREASMKLIETSQRPLEGHYDCAISFLQNGGSHSFYGGCNEFVLDKTDAAIKIGFLHCDYTQCGADTPYNNRLYERFNRIAACSEGCRKAFLSVLPQLREHSYVVTNCHDFETIRGLSEKSPVAFESGCIQILSVARLSWEKGIDRAITAVSTAVKCGSNVQYHIVGDGIMRESLEALTASLGLQNTVFFHGNQSNPYRYMKKADLLLIPSYHEAAPLVIDEAICLHLPVLSVRTTSSEDMILARKAGFVCENNQDALNICLTETVSDFAKIKECRAYLNSVCCDNRKAADEFKKLTEDSYEA